MDVNFSWDTETDALAEHVRGFGRKLSVHGVEGESFSRTRWALTAEQGLMGLCLPADLGGMGFGALKSARIIEAFAEGAGDAGLSFAACAHLFACAKPIDEFGTTAVRQLLLPDIATGARIAANAASEEGAGSDLFAMAATATRSGDGYLIKGNKNYVTNGPVADVFLVYAKTQPQWGHMGISAFVVQRGERVHVGGPIQNIGLESATLGPVYLDDCYVPSAHRLGREGQGAAIFTRSMLWERGCLFALYLGLMQRQLTAAVGFARERHQFGRPIAANQAVAHRLVDMSVRLESARLLVYRACWLIDQGEECQAASAMAKLVTSEAAVQSSLDAIALHGGLGCARGAGVESMLRHAIPGRVFSGTSDMQREVIAASMGLGT